MLSSANRNMLWASTFVNGLARAGLRAAVIAPGSRSTPLAFAFAANPLITVYSLLDERSAAFFALGIGLQSGHAAAVLCTSGTAAANFLPAIVEANHARVPMLVLTADRPPEARSSGANQTVDQVKLYGDQVRWFQDVALPEANPPGNNAALPMQLGRSRARGCGWCTGGCSASELSISETTGADRCSW